MFVRRPCRFLCVKMFMCEIACGLMLLFCVGCSEGEIASISGTVTLAGEEIAEGSLRFFPGPETPGKGAGVVIKEGRFEITEEVAKEKGLMAGKYRVSITASHNTGRKIKSPESGKMIDQILMYIPEKYNLRTGLTLELKPGPNQHDFTLAP